MQYFAIVCVFLAIGQTAHPAYGCDVFDSIAIRRTKIDASLDAFANFIAKHSERFEANDLMSRYIPTRRLNSLKFLILRLYDRGMISKNAALTRLSAVESALRRLEEMQRDFEYRIRHRMNLNWDDIETVFLYVEQLHTRGFQQLDRLTDPSSPMGPSVTILP